MCVHADDQLSSLDLVAESEEEANTLVGLLNRLVVQCQDERTVRREHRENYCVRGRYLPAKDRKNTIYKSTSAEDKKQNVYLHL